ncbi:uncharacterized protein PHACADRAFT_193414 [Phanerochaete carnosa HHB-10118-sp]|uniref:Uncharacterized protein n=1 Tax=Phanerochaete carnosa (strain HHB-10118-sp) TaxID=650164 RepID=K5WG82_PHACS|nr:uncharacterized protein PHACADRAFT_193414 [Phanerochaete carnosa HHB-10118-sp]EKM58290.1 hypothetical protein PHACADRAFT_193414 [Phanerochaete carnosa HHB-10118-sp]
MYSPGYSGLPWRPQLEATLSIYPTSTSPLMPHTPATRNVLELRASPTVPRRLSKLPTAPPMPTLQPG